MSRIPRTKSRIINVLEADYLWMVQGKVKYLNNTPEYLYLSIQLKEFPGSVLQAKLSSKYLDDNFIDDNNCIHKASIYPRDIEKLIKKALFLGWNPKEKFGCFLLKEKMELSDYRI